VTGFIDKLVRHQIDIGFNDILELVTATACKTKSQRDDKKIAHEKSVQKDGTSH
jgi:hypothetical protein